MNPTVHWIVRLLLLFPVTGAAVGALVCIIVDFEPAFGAVCGAVEGAVFGAMIAWPSKQIRFWRIALFTSAGTVLLGTSGVWAWDGALLGAIYLSPMGFWLGYGALLVFMQGFGARSVTPPKVES